MKPLKQILFILVIISGTACNPRPDRATLRTAMPLLERSEKVDSCLAVLRSIDTAALTRPADKARWALLYAMALDKNYIDTTDLSVLRPAIDRYTPWTHLSRKDKFYTWYYKGRIEENAKIYDASLDSYLHAERYMGATDDTYRTRLYFGFERVYMNTISFYKAYEAVQSALHYSKSSNNRFNYYVALLDCISLASKLNFKEDADRFLSIYKNEGDNIDSRFYPKYCRSMLIYYQSDSSPAGKDSLLSYLNRYQSIHSLTNSDDLLECAYASVLLNDYSQAERFLTSFASVGGFDELPSFYHYLYSQVHLAKGDIDKAFSELRLDFNQINEKYLYNLNNEITSDAENYHHKIKRLSLVIYGLVTFIVLLLISIFLAGRLKRKAYENKMLRQLYRDMESQHDIMYAYMSGGEKYNHEKLLHDDISKVRERLFAIVKTMKGRTESLVGVVAILSDIGGNESLMEGVSTLCSMYSGRFYRYLKEKGLNTFEVGYCTMLVLGVSIKEMGFALKRSNLYNVNMIIRAKIGASNTDSDLPLYLQDLYQNRGS